VFECGSGKVAFGAEGKMFFCHADVFYGKGVFDGDSVAIYSGELCGGLSGVVGFRGAAVVEFGVLVRSAAEAGLFAGYYV
jgi:hypothetical protein